MLLKLKYKYQSEQLLLQHATHVSNSFPLELCTQAIAELQPATEYDCIEKHYESLITDFIPDVFTPELNSLIYSYYNEEFTWRWPRLDMVDDTALETYHSTAWHCDGGPDNVLKLFVYLNPVAEHGCNTLMIDPDRTKVLRQYGALPLEQERRVTDITPYLERANLSVEVKSYDLASGDILLFNPKLLAHRCLPPKPKKRRYTLCFSIYPSSYFGNHIEGV